MSVQGTEVQGQQTYAEAKCPAACYDWDSFCQYLSLLGVQRHAITKHLQNIFESHELNENSVSSILEHTAATKQIFLRWNSSYFFCFSSVKFDED